MSITDDDQYTAFGRGQLSPISKPAMTRTTQKPFTVVKKFGMGRGQSDERSEGIHPETVDTFLNTHSGFNSRLISK